ncbi:MAG TPA: ABC transporter permease [Aggregatilineales bacterium]|nr:ABC transporter permease [Aggregatilineales bacterium]
MQRHFHFPRRLDPLLPILLPLLAVLAALAVGAVFLAVLGADVGTVYNKLISGAVGNTYSQTQTIGKAVPLLLVGLGVCIAFRSSVLNIGVEGQVIVGGLGTTACALAFKDLPGPALIGVSLLAGMLAGALWAGIPGILKAWGGVNEILSTIMMNQIAIYLLIVLLTGPMKDPSAQQESANVVQSAQVPANAWLPLIVPRTTFHLGAILAVIVAIIVYFLLWRTVIGYRIRAVGENPRAAAYAGISVKRIMLLAMLCSGALAGLAGGVEILGVTHRTIQGFSTNYGFSGIVVALFGALHPFGAIPASLLFGGLLISGSKLQSVGVSSAMVTVLQGLIVLFVVGSTEITRRLRRMSAEVPSTPEPSSVSEAQQEAVSQ